MRRSIKGLWDLLGKAKKQQGFTLSEILITVIFLALLGMALFSTLSSANTILQTQVLRASIDQGGMQLFRSMAREIAESSPAADQSHLILATDVGGNSVVTFQVPVDWDGDGDVVQNNLTQVVEWGAYRFVREPQGQSWLNGWVRYRVLNNQLIREVMTSSTGGVQATDVIIPDDVLSFQVTRNVSRLNIRLILRKTDTIGQKGSLARNFQATFDMNVFVRNGA